jgi:2-keto-4-pentenoate hydratase/2-oxohepta-3-ene-1,7-dioic acid hydratase in catechol pathway
LGPSIATKDEIPDPDDTRIKTLVNGEVMQDASTKDLCFTIARTISYFSQWFEFHPGDLFATGSPPGVGFGMKPPRFLSEGDVCELWGAGIGTLSNPVIRGEKR